MDEVVIKARVAARERARAIVELAQEDCRENVDLPSQEAFWEEIRKALPIAHRPKSKREEPMTYQESIQFGNELMPFGKFVGTRMDEVALDYLEWLSDQPFLKNLRRYLNSRRIKEEQQ